VGYGSIGAVIKVEILVERCAGIDIGKADLQACVRVPDPRGRRRQETRTFATTTGELLRLRDWLAEQQITVVGMEATGDYWKPVFHQLEDTVEVQLLNAAHMHNVAGADNTPAAASLGRI
jgi:transposase